MLNKTDKEFLSKLAESLDKSGFNEDGYTRLSKEVAEQISTRIKEIIDKN